MFNFFENIAQITGLPFEILNDGYRIINFDGKSVYVEGFKNIISFSNEQVLLKLKKGIVRISGEKLILKNININTIVINGKIANLEVS